MYATTSYVQGSNVVEYNKSNPMEQFLRVISGQEKELDVITSDHSYAKNWNSNPDAHHVKPVRMLFMKGLSRQPPTIPVTDADVDIETVSPDTALPCDNDKVKILVGDCDRFLKTTMSHKFEEDAGGDEPSKLGWNKAQNSLYKQTMKALQGNRLSRLASEGMVNEVLQRRITIDKGARRLRQIFSSYLWDMDLLCWLHHTLMSSLNATLLSEYLEILRTLKNKIPVVIDRLLAYVALSPSNVVSVSEAMSQLLKRSWDPMSNQYNKPKKLPCSPLILIVPNGPHQTLASQSQRMRFWSSQLSALGKVVYPPVHLTGTSHGLSIENCVNHVYASVQNKVVELKTHTPHRPIILLGWTIGALIASHVALEEPVSAVVCLGFPLTGVTDSHGDLDDPLLGSKVPTLFVIGQHASTCSMDDIEDFRERMKAETGLVVVGGADDMLRLSVTKKRTEGVTQTMVDKCLIDEIDDFLSSVLSPHISISSTTHHGLTKKVITNVGIQEQPPPPPQVVEDENKRKRRRPREYSPEFSPATKRYSLPPQQTLPSQKIFTSSSSSDASNSVANYARAAMACNDYAKHNASPRKVGRPPSNMPRKQQSQRSPPKIKTTIPLSALKDLPKTTIKEPTPPVSMPLSSTHQELEPPEPPKTTPITSKLNSLSGLALANQQKNAPVDVEKAFGKDSSFLPRPLTPAEFDNIPLTPTEKTPENDDSVETAIQACEVTASPVLQLTTKPTIVGVPLANVLGTKSKQGISYLRVSSATSEQPLTTYTTLSSISTVPSSPLISKVTDPNDLSKVQVLQKLKLTDSPLTLTVSEAGKSILTTKIFTSTNMNVTQVQSSLSGKTIVSPFGGSSLSQPQTVLVTPATATKPATYIVASSDSSTCPGKKIQFRRMLVKGAPGTATSIQLPMLSKLKSPSTSTVSSETLALGNQEKTVDTQSCNLSLLSDVAGMKEPIRKKTEYILNPSSSSATLVKLSSTESSSILERPLQNQIRRIRVIEAMPSPQRLETPEELVEKQMAIRALSSLDKDGDSATSPTLTTSFSGGFSKPEPRYHRGRSSHVGGYSVLMPRAGVNYVARPPIRRPRGRGTFGSPGAVRKPRVQRFYPF